MKQKTGRFGGLVQVVAVVRSNARLMTRFHDDGMRASVLTPLR